MGFQGLGFFWGFRFGVLGLGFNLGFQGLGFQGLGCLAFQGFRVSGFRAEGVGFRVRTFRNLINITTVEPTVFSGVYHDFLIKVPWN